MTAKRLDVPASDDEVDVCSMHRVSRLVRRWSETTMLRGMSTASSIEAVRSSGSDIEKYLYLRELQRSVYGRHHVASIHMSYSFLTVIADEAWHPKVVN